MTHRTEPHKSAIELATECTMSNLSAEITRQHRAHGVHIPEKEFRRMLAGYFENKSFTQWCHDLGIQPQEGDQPR